MGKKGFLLSLDAVVAAGLLLLMAGFLMSIRYTQTYPEMKYQRMYYVGRDVINTLGKTNISAFSDYCNISSLVDFPVSDIMNRTVLDVLGGLWASGKTEIAAKIANCTLYHILPKNYNYEFVISTKTSNTSIYKTGEVGEGSYVVKLHTMISGYELGKPVFGYSANAYLQRMSKTTSSYVYFGGYVGDGNITVFLELPDDANVSYGYMEIDAGNNFTLYINDEYVKEFTVNKTNMTANVKEYIDSSFFVPGENKININFTKTIEDNYIGGGYLKVVYNTSKAYTLSVNISNNTATSRYLFEGINGIINLYSGFYVPGDLKNMSIYLHYKNNLSVNNTGVPVFVNIGGKEIFRSNQTGEVYATLNDTYLIDKGLDYTKLSNKTIPLRFGTEEFFILTGVGTADSILITDVSGSMNTCDVEANCTPDLCDPDSPCHDTRLNVAKESDKEFVYTILNYTGNRVGLISYHTAMRDSHLLSNNTDSLIGEINRYSPLDYTCISCSIREAIEILNETNAPINYYYPDLWELNADKPQPVDFSSGLNTTANTFGPGAGDDGWDWAKNVYNSTSPCVRFNADPNYNNNTEDSTVAEEDAITIRVGAINSTCSSSTQPASGAYGIQFNITQDMYDVLINNGSASLSFDFIYDDNGLDSGEAAWVKARFGNTSEMHYLGSNCGGSWDDGTPDVFCMSDPIDARGSKIYNITKYIKAPGIYYMDLGVRVARWDRRDEYVTVTFDNISLYISHEDNKTRYKAMLVMSDGQANYCYPPVLDCPNTQAKQQAINFSCEARELGITVYSVAFGNDADNETLRKIACWNCTSNDWIPNCTRFYNSSNAEELKRIYREIAESMGNASYRAQTISITGNISMKNVLYPDSYIQFNYTPIKLLGYGEVILTLESERFGGNVTSPKNGSFYIYDSPKVLGARVTSYSSEYWTDRLLINSSKTGGNWQTVYNLSEYALPYIQLGDPYIVNIPANLISTAENNSVSTDTGISPTNRTGGSPDSRVIYDIAVPGMVGYGDIFETKEEAIQDAIQRLKNNLSVYNISVLEANAESKYISNVPSLWGPAIFEVRIWG